MSEEGIIGALAGSRAWRNGLSWRECPYPEGSEAACGWHVGWENARLRARRLLRRRFWARIALLTGLSRRVRG